MAFRWEIATLTLGCVIQLAAPAMAAEPAFGWGDAQLDAWLPLPPVLEQPLVTDWTPRLERAPRPMANLDTTAATQQPQRARRGPGGPGGPGGGAMAALPQDGIFEFTKYLRVPSPRLGNVELSAAVAGLHTQSEQPAERTDLGMDGGPSSTFQVAAKYLVDRHVSVTFGLNGAQSQVQAPSDVAAQQVAATTPRPRTGAMRGFAAISNIGPNMVQRLVNTSVLPSASVQYAGPYGLNLSLGVASNPLDVSGAADVQFHATYRTDFRDRRVPVMPAPLGPAVGPLANR